MIYLGNPHQQLTEWASFDTMNIIRLRATNGFGISTRSGKLLVDYGDGSAPVEINPIKMTDAVDNPITLTGLQKTYASSGVRTVQIGAKKGLKDVYSLDINKHYNNHAGSGYENAYDIPDFGTFINQFPNLYSLKLYFYNYIDSNRYSDIRGYLNDIPKSVERFWMSGFNNASPGADLDVGDFPIGSQLKWLRIESTPHPQQPLNTYGDISKLPSGIYYFYCSLGSTPFTYTQHKVWASAFDTFSINRGLTITETDMLVEDLADSVTSAIGDKLLNFGGSLTTRNTDVSYLDGLGFTIQNLVVLDVQNSLWSHLKTKEPPADTLEDSCIVSGASWAKAGTTGDISFPVGGGIKNSGAGIVQCSSPLIGSLCDENGDLPFTIVVRINVDSWNTNGNTFYAKDVPGAGAGTGREWNVRIDNSDKKIWLTLFSQNNSSNRRVIKLSTVCSLSTDYHVVVEYDGTNYKAYLNNVEDTSLSFSDVGTYVKMIPTDSKMSLMNFGSNNSGWNCKGTGKYFRLYINRALTASDVDDLYNGDEDTVV